MKKRILLTAMCIILALPAVAYAVTGITLNRGNVNNASRNVRTAVRNYNRQLDRIYTLLERQEAAYARLIARQETAEINLIRRQQTALARQFEAFHNTYRDAAQTQLRRRGLEGALLDAVAVRNEAVARYRAGTLTAVDSRLTTVPGLDFVTATYRFGVRAGEANDASAERAREIYRAANAGELEPMVTPAAILADLSRFAEVNIEEFRPAVRDGRWEAQWPAHYLPVRRGINPATRTPWLGWAQ